VCIYIRTYNNTPLCCRAEKEKQALILEIDGLSTQLDGSNKARAHAESKLEGLEDALRRLKAQVEDLTRNKNELVGYL
jgi:chromosome segregation ATPase